MRLQPARFIQTVDRFILAELFSAMAFLSALFFTLSFVMLLFDEFDEILENNVSFVTGLAYVLLNIPHEMVRACPFIVTLSVIVAVGRMIQRNEMLMLFVAGYHPFRLAAPLLAVFVAIMGGIYFINENISGPFAAKADMLLRWNQENDAMESMSGLWMHGEQNRIFRINEYKPHQQTIEGLSIFEFRGERDNVSARLDAETAVYDTEQGAWTLRQVVAHYIQPDGSVHREQYPEFSYLIGRTPQDLVKFAQVSEDPEKMSHSDLLRIVNEMKSMGENPRQYLTYLRMKEAFAFSVIFLGLLSFSFLILSDLKSQASGIGLGLVATIAYFLALMLCKSISMSGFLPPSLVLWMPNLFTLCLIGAFSWKIYKTI
ncbi:MAG: LptF/LptG family permease [bacterium]|nr:LptF/LptG family permease [bacterium]